MRHTKKQKNKNKSRNRNKKREFEETEQASKPELDMAGMLE